MIMKGKGIAKTLISFVFVSIMLILMIVPASAKSAYEVDSNGTLTAINLAVINPMENPTLKIPSGVKTILSGVVKGQFGTNFYASPDKVKGIEIPSTTTHISSGAFNNCTGLTKVTIDNYKEAVTVENGAFPSGVVPIYTKVKPTTTTTNPPKKTTVAAKVTTTAHTSTTTQKVVTTTAKKKTNKVTTTKPVETTEATTEPTTVVVTDETPFADAKAQLGDMNVWQKMLDESTKPVADPAPVKNTFAKTASYAAVVVVAISAVGLGYLKFRK